MKKTIMIVEDEQHFHDLYAVMLEDTDYRIISAYDGDEAIRKLEEESPDIIILNMHLDLATGDTFFLYLKGMQEYVDIPIIIISAYPERKYKNLKETFPNLAYIDKSYLTKEKLLDGLREKLSCSRN